MSLIFNISPYYICSNFITNTPDKIAIAPKLSRPKLSPQFRKLFKNLSCRYTFKYLYYLRRRISRRYCNKYMHMVFHYFHRVYIKLIFFGYLLKYLLQIPRNFIPHYVFSVLWYPYQMIFQIIYGVFCPLYSHTIFIAPINTFGNGQTRLMAIHFHPASKLTGIQWRFL